MSGGTTHAVRLGLRRGWTEFGQSVRSPQDQAFYVFMGMATLAYLWFNREDEVEGTALLYPTVALPSILAALVAFNVVMGPASALVMEREDGTLLRYRSLPHGMQGYVTGQVLHHSLGLLAGARLYPNLAGPDGEAAVGIHSAAYLKYVF